MKKIRDELQGGSREVIVAGSVTTEEAGKVVEAYNNIWGEKQNVKDRPILIIVPSSHIDPDDEKFAEQEVRSRDEKDRI